MKKVWVFKITGAVFWQYSCYHLRQPVHRKKSLPMSLRCRRTAFLYRMWRRLRRTARRRAGSRRLQQRKGRTNWRRYGRRSREKDSGVSQNSAGENVSGNQVSGDGIPDEDGSGEETEGQDVSGNKIPARELLRPCGMMCPETAYPEIRFREFGIR